jgi:ATP-dependent DNA helicase RecG
MSPTASAPIGSRAPPATPPRAFATGDPQDREALLRVPLRSVPRPSRLEAPLRTIRGVGPRLAEAAAEIGLATIGDLLLHAPRDYPDREDVSAIAELVLGQEATVLVEVRSARLIRPRRRNLRIVEARVADGSGPMKAVWFNQAWLAERLVEGTRALLRGKLDRSGFRVREYELLAAGGPLGSGGSMPSSAGGVGHDADSGGRRGPEGDADLGRRAVPWASRPDAPPAGVHTTGIVAVHGATEGLRQSRIREWAWRALALAPQAIEPLPARLRARLGMAPVADALVAAHFPSRGEEAEAARRRLAFEELILHQAALVSRRRARARARAGVPLPGPGAAVEEWIGSLPFEPTGDQRRAFEELDADLCSERPMQRLLMGEVGSGKTVVALYAMLRAREGGFQAALMAPTETLAEQHFATLERLLGGAPIPIALLTASTPRPRRDELLGRLASGELELVVGTHALIEEEVSFARLAVAVVDEQHRFGVRQRAALDANGPGPAAPHALHMTATPIPRTLSLTAYGDLDASTLRELPAGRRPVRTWVVGEEKRAGAYEYLRGRLREGRQAYVVCPLVAESEKIQARAATEEVGRLAAGELREFRLDVLHGQMPVAEKQAAMARFVSGEVDVLVATSLIEVGIDVANAAVMVIEGADRYGLSQLHQLRGRVGRAEHESACILFGDGGGSERARLRLEAIARERDGFKLAEVDLSLRGEGEILGTRQHGLPRFRFASFPEDAGLLSTAREEVIAMLERHGTLDAPELGPLLDAARARFGDERADPIAA